MLGVRCKRSILTAAIFLFSVSVLRAQDSVELELVAGGLSQPLGAVSAEDGSGRLFLVEQGGQIKVLENGSALGQPFLNLTDQVSCCGERGLLGLAFHPNYESNGFFFVNYTNRAGNTVVSRFAVSNNPNRANAGSEREVLSFNQPFSNHNGGHLAFGPDGFLYIAAGDGGSGGDPRNNAQNLGNLLGKLLRVNVDSLPLAIPPDNPFVNNPNARPEIWSYGLRNPWRFSFDRRTGDVFIGDVGQGSLEEIDFQPSSSTGGENYGWRLMEGSECFEPSSGCDDGSLVKPIIDYGRNLGCSVTGGYLHRGTRSPSLNGVYIYGDFCAGTIWGAEPNSRGVWVSRVLAQTNFQISSFGEDEEGEVYVVDLSGAVYRLSGNEIFGGGFESGNFAGWKRRGAVELVEPGLVGSNFALRVSADSGGRPFVRTNAPRREKSIAASFYLKVNGVDLGRGQADVFRFGNGSTTVLRLELQQTGPRKYRVALYAADAGAERLVGRTGVPRQRAVRLGIEWNAEGFARLLKKNRGRGSTGGLANGSLSVQSLEAGFPGGVPSGSSGSIVLDEFVLAR